MTAAAVFLFVDAALILLLCLLTKEREATGFVVVGIEVLIGLFLLRSSKAARIGGVLWNLLFVVALATVPRDFPDFSSAEKSLVWLLILYRGSLFVLLLGKVGKRGTQVTVAFGILALFAFVGIVVAHNLGTGAALREATLPGTQYVSPKSFFEISLPNSDWTLVKTPSRPIPSPIAEVGMMRWDMKAVAYVIADRAPRGKTLPDVQTFKNRVLEFERRYFSALTVQSEQNVQVGPWPGVLVSYRAEKGPQQWHYLTLYVVADPYFYRIIASAKESDFAAHEAEMRAILASFKVRGK